MRILAGVGLCLLALAPLSTLACESKRSQPLILRGQVDEGDPAVVALRMGSNYYCTGTLVAPTWVLTAAHCFDRGGDVALSYRSTDIYGDGGWKPAKALHIEPGWVANDTSITNFEHDVALVELAVPARASITPVPINYDASAARRLDHVRMVGFGPTATGHGDQGTKRSAEVPVTPKQEFFRSRPGNGACYGDSGGPSFATIDGVEKVVAITSHHLGDSCEAMGGHTVRTDRHRAFLGRYLANVPGPSAPPSASQTPPPPVAQRPPPTAPSTPPTAPTERAPVECAGSEQIVLQGTSIRAQSGPAVRASGSCQVILVDVDVKAPVGIDASGSSQVIMTRGSIDAASKPVISNGSAQVQLAGTSIKGS